MKAESNMTNLGELAYFLGLELVRTSDWIIVEEKKFIGEVLKMFNMVSCNPVATPMEANLKLVKDDVEESNGGVWLKSLGDR